MRAKSNRDVRTSKGKYLYIRRVYNIPDGRHREIAAYIYRVYIYTYIYKYYCEIFKWGTRWPRNYSMYVYDKWSIARLLRGPGGVVEKIQLHLTHAYIIDIMVIEEWTLYIYIYIDDIVSERERERESSVKRGRLRCLRPIYIINIYTCI